MAQAAPMSDGPQSGYGVIDDAERRAALDTLLVGAKPLESIHDLAIPELTREEGDAFMRAIVGPEEADAWLDRS